MSVGLLIAHVWATDSHGADYALIPQLRLEGNYNDNVFFDPEDEDRQEDYITIVSPGLLWRRHAERSLGEVFAQGRFVDYQEEEDLDKTDQLYRGTFDYQATEHLDLGATARYTIDNQIDRDIDVTGLAVGTAERRRQDYGVTMELLISENTHLDLFGGYREEGFDDAEFFDNWGVDLVMGLRHRPKLWLNTILHGQVAYRHYDFNRDQTETDLLLGNTRITETEEDNVTDNVALTVGVENRRTERLTLSVHGGARFTRRDSEVSRRQRLRVADDFLELSASDASDTDDLWGFVGNAELAYRGERNEVRLGLSHDLQPVSGSGDTAQRTSLNGSWWYQMTTEWRFNAGVNYYLNQSDDTSTSDRDFDTVTFTAYPRVRYAFSRDLYLEGQYRYTQVDDREDNEIRRRHLAVATLFVQHDLLD
ncbi:MAG: hypothetical protein QNJ22_22885 [Desulfosarcinaceae bacterium]|nr:hypothetical protein [Desulfosarcinaceae bacterium]